MQKPLVCVSPFWLFIASWHPVYERKYIACTILLRDDSPGLQEAQGTVASRFSFCMLVGDDPSCQVSPSHIGAEPSAEPSFAYPNKPWVMRHRTEEGGVGGVIVFHIKRSMPCPLQRALRRYSISEIYQKGQENLQRCGSPCSRSPSDKTGPTSCANRFSR